MANEMQFSFRIAAEGVQQFGRAMTNAGAVVSDLGASVRDMNRAAGDVSKIVRMRSALEGAQGRFGESSEAAAKLRKEIENTSAPSRLLIKDLADAERAAAKDAREVERLANRLAQAERASGTAGKATADLVAWQNELTRSAKDAADKQARLAEINQKIAGQKEFRAGIKRAGVAVGALGASIGATIVQAGAFSDDMMDVARNSGYSSEEMERVEAAIRGVARGSSTARGDLAAVASSLGGAGVPAADLGVVLERVTALAEGTGGSLDATADAVVSGMRNWGIAASDAGLITDVLAATSEQSGIGMNDLSKQFLRVAPHAQAAGVSLGDAATAIGAMVAEGTEARLAGRELRTHLKAMAKDGGIELADGLRGGAAALDEMRGKILASEGAADRLADAFRMSFSAQLQNARNQATDLSLTFGAALLPAITDALDAVRPLIEGFAQWATENPELVATIAKVAAAGTLISGALLGVSFAASTVYSGILAIKAALLVTNGGFLVATKSAIAFGAALLANPITWIVAGVVALGAAVYLLIKNWDRVVPFIEGVWDGVRGAFSAGFDAVRGIAAEGLELLKNIFWDWNPLVIFHRKMWEIARAPEEFFPKLLESGAALMGALVDGIKSMARAPVDALKGALSKARDLLPFSDAKEGPLSDLTESGRRMVTTFADGADTAGRAPAEALERALAPRGAAGGQGGGVSAASAPRIEVRQEFTFNGAAAPDDVRAAAASGVEDLIEQIMTAMRREERLSYGG